MNVLNKPLPVLSLSLRSLFKGEE